MSDAGRGICRLLLIVVVLSSTPAYADTHWANIDGSNTPPYTSYATGAHYLQDVIPVLDEGDTLMVAAGEYDLDSTVFIPARTVWAGVGRDSVVINYTDPTRYYSRRPAELGKNVEIYGLEFNYPKGTSYNRAVYIYSYSPDTLRVYGCRFRELALITNGTGRLEAFNNEFYYGIYKGLGVGTSSGWMHHNSFFGKTGGYGIALIAANGYYVIEHNVFNEDPIGRPIGVMVDHATYVEIRNNSFLNSSCPISWYYASGVVENNTMVVASGLPGGYYPHNFIPVFLRSYETLIYRNNVMLDFTAPWEFGAACAACDTTGWITFAYNVFWPPKEIHYRKYPDDHPELVKLFDSANFCAYPMFVGDSNYQLQVGSPLIDAGDPTIFDVDSSRADIGMYGGLAGSTYVYPQIAPEAPESIWVTDEDSLVTVIWSARPEADLAGYRVYRDTISGFYYPGLIPTLEFGSGDTAAVDDAFPAGVNLYYVVTAVDTAGLEGNPSPEGVAVFTGILDESVNAQVPLIPRIIGTYPNPFNSSTIIEVSIPEVGAAPVRVQIDIYDTLGRKVATAFDGSLSYGIHRVEWDGNADNGRALSSGMYFAQLNVWGKTFGSPVKLVMVK